MFKKIVSRLSLSPSATSELAFYARRLKQERVTRTFSAIAAILVIGLQIATIAAPPTPVNAASPSDIIYGGIVSKADLLNKYDSSSELKGIFAHFGVTRSDLNNSTKFTIKSSEHEFNSLSRIDHGRATPVSIGGTTYYYRPLYYADSGGPSTYEVFGGKRAIDGGFFGIMMLCGNLVFKTVPPKPVASLNCVSLTADSTTGVEPKVIKFTGKGAAVNDTIANYIYDYGDGTSSTVNATTTSHSYGAGLYTATLRIRSTSGIVTAPTGPCTVYVKVTKPAKPTAPTTPTTPTTPTAPTVPVTPVTPPAPADFTKLKSALNVTQNIDATTKPAQGGDVIRYTLTTTNTGGTAEKYAVVEHLEDVLEYADITDTGGGILTNGVLSWAEVKVNPRTSLIKTFTAKVRNPIASTPVGLSDPYSYDLQMDNVYGNAVHVILAPPVPKQIEKAASNLPQTGPGETSVVILLIACGGLFFYFRNRQIAAEVQILRHDHNGGTH